MTAQGSWQKELHVTVEHKNALSLKNNLATEWTSTGKRTEGSMLAFTADNDYTFHHFLAWSFLNLCSCVWYKMLWSTIILTNSFKYCLQIWRPTLFKTIKTAEKSLYIAKSIDFREHLFLESRWSGRKWLLVTQQPPQLPTMTLRMMHAANPGVYRMFEDLSSHW